MCGPFSFGASRVTDVGARVLPVFTLTFKEIKRSVGRCWRVTWVISHRECFELGTHVDSGESAVQAPFRPL